MDEFASGLYSFLLTRDGLRGEQRYTILIFVTSCAILGMLVVILDTLYYSMRKKSFFMFNYSRKNFFAILLGWSGGAAITGFLGQILDILQISLLASTTAGVAWPIIMARLLKDVEAQAGNPKEQSSATDGAGSNTSNSVTPAVGSESDVTAGDSPESE